MELHTFPDNSAVSIIRLESHIYGGPQSIKFASLIDTALENKSQYIIVDAADVEIMNSSGLGMLVNAHTTASKQNSAIALVSVPEKIMQLLKMTRLDSVLSIFTSVEEAVESKS